MAATIAKNPMAAKKSLKKFNPYGFMTAFICVIAASLSANAVARAPQSALFSAQYPLRELADPDSNRHPKLLDIVIQLHQLFRMHCSMQALESTFKPRSCQLLPLQA
jgi:hypothetical protein